MILQSIACSDTCPDLVLVLLLNCLIPGELCIHIATLVYIYSTYNTIQICLL